MLAASAMTNTADSIPANIAIRIRNLRKSFDQHLALEHIDLDVYEGEFLSLLGPSGCGKTTLLRIIAGFEYPDQGEVRIGGVDALRLPAYKRPVNTVFQSYALFPHMTILQNVLFGLKMARVPKAQALERAQEAMRMVEIQTFAQRKPLQLSGGQRQRVALARAIVNEPKVLLLDEPLGALDLKLRKQLQIELMQLQKRLGITFVYVTHDQEEALVMSDRVAVMKTGLIDQLGAAEDIYERPRSRYVATFLGSSNLLEAQVRHIDPETISLDTPLGTIRSTVHDAGNGARHGYRVGQQLTVSIRPEKLYVLSQPRGYEQENLLQGEIEEIIYTGVESQYLVRVGQGESSALLSAYVMNKALTEHNSFAIGDSVHLVLPSKSVVLLND